MPSRGISGLRVSLDEFLILDRYSLLGAQLRWFCYPLSLYIGRGVWGLGSSNCSVEISALMFCSMVLCGGGVLLGYLLPGLAGLGA